MGPSYRPNAVQSHDGVYPTQTTHNGGGRRVPLQWKCGDPIEGTRLTTPLEAVRIASLPADYQEFVAEFDDSNEFLFRCVNMGVPLRTSSAIDIQIHSLLVQAGVQFDIDVDNVPGRGAIFDQAHAANVLNHKSPWAGLLSSIRSIQFDTGANGTFMYTDVEPYMEEPIPSNVQIQTAGDTVLQGGLKGTMRSYVLNLANYKDIKTVTDFNLYPTTVKGLQKELLSADEYFRHGKFNVLLRQPDFEDGVSELYRPPQKGIPEARIPLVYDYTGKGGWHMCLYQQKL